MDASQVGRYGTISFMKRLQPDIVVATFPVDDEQITFGRHPNCSVRLYYKAVSAVHCKLTFQEHKAFLVVLGTNGVIVDGCQVFPSTSPTAPTTIPLINNSEIEIHNKRFKFNYPPKELRAALLATPRGDGVNSPRRRRALRMSMIQSAQVFSPRPSDHPYQSLQILQSPIKPFKTPSKTENTIPNPQDPDEQEVVLVDGDCPRVLEEEKDLVILEDVEVDAEDVTPKQESHAARSLRLPHVPRVSYPLSTPQPPQTPRRRIAGDALHKAVLIRSAQRVVLKAELEREEEEEEEKEVEDVVVTDILMASSQSSEDDPGNEDAEEQEDEENEAAQGTISRWRKSLEAVSIWPFSSAAPPESAHKRENEDANVQNHNDVEPEAMEGIETLSDQLQTPQPQQALAPSRKHISDNFFTPQVNRKAVSGSRYSHGVVGEAKRVAMDQTWRVNDIVVPKKTDHTPIKGGDNGDTMTQTVRSPRQKLSDEERKAIQERRRSALRTPDAFFGGLAPGMRRASGILGSPVVYPSPSKMQEAPINEDLDTKSLLEKMKETVEGMKRRRESVGPRMSLGIALSPSKPSGFSLLAPERDGQGQGASDEMDVDMENLDEGHDNLHADMASSPMRVGTKTPKTKDPNGIPQDTAMPTLKGIFAEPRVAQTPMFERVEEMTENSAQQDVVEGEEEEIAPKRKSTRSKGSSSKTTTAVKRRTQRLVSAEVIAEDPSENHDDGISKGARRERGASKQPESDTENGDTTKYKARSLRGAIKPVDDIVEGQEDEPEIQPPTKVGKSKRGKTVEEAGLSEHANKARSSSKKKTNPAQVRTEEDSEEAPKAATRRGRKAAAESEPSPSVDEATLGTATKPTRKAKAAKVQETLPAEPETEIPAARKVRMRSKAQNTDGDGIRGGPGRHEAKVKPAEGDMDDDPLDTIGGEDVEMRDEMVVASATKGRRGVRAKNNMMEVVREETMEGVEPEPELPVEATAGKRKTTAKTSAKSSGGSGTRSSARSTKTATPVVAPGTDTPVDDVMDKENTPGSGLPEGDDSKMEKTVKVRVSRTKKASATKKVVAEGDGTAEVLPRATRTRARK